MLRMRMWVSGERSRSCGGDPEAGVAGHGDVEHGDIGVEARGQLQRLGAGGGFGDDGEAGLALQHVADPGADDRVIVGDQDADRGLAHRG